MENFAGTALSRLACCVFCKRKFSYFGKFLCINCFKQLLHYHVLLADQLHNADCVDLHTIEKDCRDWALFGKCKTDEWMLENCQKTCGLCGRCEAFLSVLCTYGLKYFSFKKCKKDIKIQTSLKTIFVFLLRLQDF